MDKSVRDIKRFIINQMINSDWSSEGRSNYYSNGSIIVKKDYDNSVWLFSIGNATFHSFDNLSINKYLVYVLILFVKRSDNKRKNSLKNDKLKIEWKNFLANKNISSENKKNNKK